MAEWKRQEEVKRVAKSHKDSKDDLLSIIDGWAETKRLEAFFTDAAQRLEGLDEGERTKIGERLHQARKLIGANDTVERFRSWKTPEER